MSTVLTQIKLEIAGALRWAAWYENKFPANVEKIREFEDEAAQLEVIYRKLAEEMSGGARPCGCGGLEVCDTCQGPTGPDTEVPS